VFGVGKEVWFVRRKELVRKSDLFEIGSSAGGERAKVSKLTATKPVDRQVTEKGKMRGFTVKNGGQSERSGTAREVR